MRNYWIVALGVLILLSGLALPHLTPPILAQGSGGAFLPSFNYVITGFWNFTHKGVGVMGTNTGPAAFQINGTAVYEIAEAGITTLSGSNPTSITMTPLKVIDGCTVTTVDSASPGLDPYSYTVGTTAVAGRLDIYAWKATSSSNPTLVASTSTAQVQYQCTGR